MQVRKYVFLEYSSILVCKYASLQVCKYETMKICKYTKMQVLEFARIQEGYVQGVKRPFQGYAYLLFVGNPRSLNFKQKVEFRKL